MSWKFMAEWTLEDEATDEFASSKDEYSILNSKHFIGIHGYMIVYSVASKQSFEMARIIRDKILNHLVRITFHPYMPFHCPRTMLTGNF